MELSFRALNEMDILIDPMKNGIFSSLVQNRMCSNDIIESMNTVGIYLTKKEIFEMNLGETKRNSYEELMKVHYELNRLNENGFGRHIEAILSNVNAHATKQHEKTKTDFISTTKDPKEAINKYYLEQNINNVAVMNYNNIANGPSEITIINGQPTLSLVLDYTKEIIWNLNKKGEINNYNAMANVFACAEKQVIYSHYIPIEKISTILTPLEMDLIYNDCFIDYNYYLLSEEDKNDLRNKLIYILLNNEKSKNDELYCFLLKEHYTNFNSIKYISEKHELNIEKMIKEKRNIIHEISKLTNTLDVDKIKIRETELLKTRDSKQKIKR